ncbi:MAG: aminoacyl-tRNA hydrolase [Actinobacteria bacterium HGW-Actinobacteria-7]|jgi:PTH1 family peptidyl-tRNA hydrolase|nr:MAG: aminoacyl-tRNA hydrolase [Actinobacteria bacterium HGW-Actinobacteria-7]
MTWLVVGLGNPGPDYERTRHNAGFFAVDLLGENLRASYWKDEAGAKVAVVRLGDDELVLAKPQTFMNVSGSSVKKLAESHGVAPEAIIIIHDDIDLAPGRVLCKRGGGHGGHNGLRSVHEKLGTDAYLRVRVGVGRPHGRMDPADWVLQQLRGSSFEELESSVPTAAQAVLHIIEHGIDSAMQEYNAD